MNRPIAPLGTLLLAASLVGCGGRDGASGPEHMPASTPSSRPSSPSRDPGGDDSAGTPQANSAASADLLRFDDPIFPEGAGVVLLPVRLDEGEHEETSSDAIFVDKAPSSRRGGEGPREERSIANIIVIDKLTGASRALLDRPALITRFELLPEVEARRSIIYAIIDRDTDGDSSLTSRDEVGCYVSDVAGSGLRRISDTGGSIRNWYVDGSALYLRVVVDADRNGVFDRKDREERILRYDMGSDQNARRVVGEGLTTATIAIARKPVR